MHSTDRKHLCSMYMPIFSYFVFLCYICLWYRLDAGTFATMGLGCGFAIAAALVNKSKPVEQQSPVVCIQGDSAFGFSGMEVETASR